MKDVRRFAQQTVWRLADGTIWLVMDFTSADAVNDRLAAQVWAEIEKRGLAGAPVSSWERQPGDKVENDLPDDAPCAEWFTREYGNPGAGDIPVDRQAGDAVGQRVGEGCVA